MLPSRSSGGKAGNGGAANNGGGGEGGSRIVDASIDVKGPTDARPGTGGRGSFGEGDSGVGWPCTPVNEDSSFYKAGSTLSDDEVSAAFSSIRTALLATAANQDPEAFAVALRAAVGKAPHVGVTGIGRDCTVLVRLTDGTPISVFDPLQGFPGSPATDAGYEATDAGWMPALQLPLGALAAPVDTTLPGSAEVRIGDIEGFARKAIPHVKKAFEKRGYHVSVGMSSADLRTGVNNLGVLWLSTHGTRECEDEDGGVHFCIATDALDPSDPEKCVLSDPKACTQNDDDVKKHLLASYFIGKEGNFYAINEDWVNTYWTFAPHALVFIDGCESLAPVNANGGKDPLVGSFTEALAGRRAGTYMGWSGAVSASLAETAADYFFDRVLGGNKDRLSPPQRPFSVQTVYSVMQARRLINDPKTPGTLLRLTKLDPDEPDVILAPSIRNMTVGDPSSSAKTRLTEQATNTKLYIDGEFGNDVDEGSVDVAGGGLSTWSGRQVVANLAPTSNGPVVVKVPRPPYVITSNAVPLTSWRGNSHVQSPFTSTFAGVHSNLDCAKVHLRADIHPFRLAPETPAVAGTVTAAGTIDPFVPIRNAAADTTCTGTIGGSFSSTGVSGVLTERVNFAIPWIDSDTSPGSTSWYIVNADIDTKLRRIYFIPTYSICTSATITAGTVVKTTDPFCLGGELAAQVPGQFDPTWSSASGNMPPACVNGDPCKIDYTLTVEIPTAPTSDTEG